MQGQGICTLGADGGPDEDKKLYGAACPTGARGSGFPAGALSRLSVDVQAN